MRIVFALLLVCTILFVDQAAGQCNPTGGHCTVSSDCCGTSSLCSFDDTHYAYMCCKGTNAPCTNNSECCNHAACIKNSTSGSSFCGCLSPGSNCSTYDNHCCGVATSCLNGQCTCTPLNNRCYSSAECCGGASCIDRYCNKKLTFETLQGEYTTHGPVYPCATKALIVAPCTNNSDCCTNVCSDKGLCDCNRPGIACSSNDNCCGVNNVCSNGTCTCTALNYACAFDYECCFGASCTQGFCEIATTPAPCSKLSDCHGALSIAKLFEDIIISSVNAIIAVFD